nr:hypothetical protein [Tanacetum cinerariifolium]
AAGPPLTTTGPSVNGGWWAGQRAGLGWFLLRFQSFLPPPPAQYLVHQSLAASRRHVAASYWTAASDVAATSAPVNAGHRRSTPPTTGQRRRITVVIGGQRWRSTTVAVADHRSTVAVNDGRRWRTTVDCRWTTVDHRRTTGQRWRSTTVADGEPPLTVAGPPLTTAGPPVNGVVPKLRKTRTAHIDYIRHTQGEAATLRKIVESERLLSPLNTSLYYACKYTWRIQELLVTLQQTCPYLTDIGTKLETVIPKNTTKQIRQTAQVTKPESITITTLPSTT